MVTQTVNKLSFCCTGVMPINFIKKSIIRIHKRLTTTFHCFENHILSELNAILRKCLRWWIHSQRRKRQNDKIKSLLANTTFNKSQHQTRAKTDARREGAKQMLTLVTEKCAATSRKQVSRRGTKPHTTESFTHFLHHLQRNIEWERTAQLTVSQSVNFDWLKPSTTGS
jgi:hypothetical protein